MHDAKPVAENRSVFEDLLLLNSSIHYRQWLHSLSAPFIGRRILETGAGVGNYTELLVGADYLLASDSDPTYVDILTQKFKGNKSVNIMGLDIARIEPPMQTFLRAQQLDTILSFNVLEHIEDDRACIHGLLDLLAPRGRLVLMVPAFPALFNSLDKAYGHYRRYRRSDFERMDGVNGTFVEHVQYFNFPGMMGWWWSGRNRRTNLPARQTALFDKCVPLIRRIERCLPVFAGLSVLAVLGRKGTP